MKDKIFEIKEKLEKISVKEKKFEKIMTRKTWDHVIDPKKSFVPKKQKIFSLL